MWLTVIASETYLRIYWKSGFQLWIIEIIVKCWQYFTNNCIVTSSKRRHKNSMKCAIAKFLSQDGRHERYLKLKRMMENSTETSPHPARERTHRHRSMPEIAVLCHLPRKTSQLPAKPEEWPKRWRNSEVCIFCMCHLVGPKPRLADTAAWCFFSLLYHICGFCRCLTTFYPLFHPV